MSFGGQTISFIAFADNGVPGALGTIPQSETSTPVAGCRHRPLTFKESAEYDVDVSTQVWKSTCPPDVAVLAAKSDGVIEVGGVRFRIIAGPQHHPDMDGSPFKVTLLSQRQES